MKYKIAFIAPYKEMAELFLKVCDEFNRKIVIELGI